LLPIEGKVVFVLFVAFGENGFFDEHRVGERPGFAWFGF
jgi:hypothetical protein